MTKATLATWMDLQPRVGHCRLRLRLEVLGCRLCSSLYGTASERGKAAAGVQVASAGVDG